MKEVEEQRLRQGKCCWQCRYYTRPRSELAVDGPKSAICVVNRNPNMYSMQSDLVEGERHSEPDYWCRKFEMDLAPRDF